MYRSYRESEAVIVLTIIPEVYTSVLAAMTVALSMAAVIAQLLSDTVGLHRDHHTTVRPMVAGVVALTGGWDDIEYDCVEA